MKIFGFFGEDDGAKLLDQVTLEMNAMELRELSVFLLLCATEIESDEEWEHEHLSDYLGQNLECDFVVYNQMKS